MTWKLKRTNQCAKCPWKVSTNPHEIPNGYSVEAHKALSSTIADRHAARIGGTLKVMACHEHPPGDEAHCIGWLMNQLGPGNNIGLRIQMISCENAKHIKLDGKQHATFAATLPRKRRKVSA